MTERESMSLSRKWLLFFLLDVLVIALFLGIRSLRARRELPAPEVGEGAITELAS